MSVGAIGGGGGGGASGAGGGAAAGAAGAGAAGAAGAGGPAAVGAVEGKGSGSGSDTDTKAVEMTGGGQGIQLPQMSTQDFCALRTQAATPVEENQGVDLQKMLEWLMAIKMLEAMNDGGGQ